MILLASCEHRPSEVISPSRATLVYSGVANNHPDEFVSAASRPKKIRSGHRRRARHSVFGPSSLRVFRLMKWSRLQAGQVITSYSVSGPSSSSSSKMCSTFKLVFGQVKMNAILQTTSDCVREPGQERTVLVPDGEQRMIAAAPAAAKNQKKERPVKTAPSRLMGNQALKGFAHQIGRSGLSNPFARRPSCECAPFFCDPAPRVGRCGGKCVNKIPCDAKPSHCNPIAWPGGNARSPHNRELGPNLRE